ncbi:hypothetical protein pipiens_018175, partial [Culex pipiens pipiens]
MSRHLAAKYLASHRKRKREERERENRVVAPLRQAEETIADRDEEEEGEQEMEKEEGEQEMEEEEEIKAPKPRRPAKTSAERVREFRQRKKLKAQEEAERGGTVAAGNPAATVNLEPMPGPSTGPVRFYPRPDPVQIPSGSGRGTFQADSETFLETGTTATAGGKPDCAKADIAFHKKFTDNKLGDYCNVCERIWFSNDLRSITSDGGRVLVEAGHFESVAGFKVCQTCHNSLRNGKVPTLSTSNGFTYPEKPANLPPLDPITERLIAPRLP